VCGLKRYLHVWDDGGLSRPEVKHPFFEDARFCEESSFISEICEESPLGFFLKTGMFEKGSD
jgi:hypothetical protein